MSLGGIAFGVGFFIVTQAQVSGFQEFFIKTVLGTDGAIRIEDKFQGSLPLEAASSSAQGTNFFTDGRESRRYVEGVEYPDKIVAALAQVPNVAAASAVLRGGVRVESALRGDAAHVLGIELADHLAVSDLDEQVIFGSLEEFRATPTGLIVGKKLAERLQAKVGESLVLEAAGQRLRYRIAAIFESGVSDIDRVRIFMHLGHARSLLLRPHGVSFIQVSLFDRERAPLDAALIERLAQHGATPWQEREKVWLDVFRALQISAAITVSTILFISGLGMFNTLAMIVMEKTREIAILRSMGYTRRDISNVFLWQGALVLAVGVVVGFVLGASLTYGIASLPLRIRGIFSTDSYVVAWSAYHYILAAATAVAIVMFASLAPARRAARLIPGDVIRGTAS